MDLSTMWNMKYTIFKIGILIILITHCHGRLHQGTHYCEHYDRNECENCEPTVEDCSTLKNEGDNTSYDDVRNYMLCYSSWILSNSTHEPVMLLKGCWLNDNCQNKKECVEHRSIARYYFCCCDGDLCNKQFYHRPIFTEKDHDNMRGDLTMTQESNKKTGVIRRKGDYELKKTILCSIVPLVGVGIVLIAVYLMWRRHRRHVGHHQLPTMDPNLLHTPAEDSFSIQLIEHKAKGRFGYVWKALLLDQYVAVKIFPLADKKSFSAEVDIYKLPNMKHKNILLFIGSEVREENSYTEFFLITEYHERGSLFDFLKANTITWAQLCRIGETMTSGLAYLHDEIPATYSTPMKPAIAHRDFKSKNVLIKSDLSACIADFGLALAFDPSLGVNETHTQVGTRRYMAPEVLEGAICFNMDSFLRIDMYACSLVVWELMTRCTCVEDVVDDYRLPFEAEVGLQPSLEEMQPLVAGQKRRPAIKPAWYQSQGMSSLVTTMEECWDQDAEARLSAGCVHERISQLSRTINAGGDNNNTSINTPPPPLSSPPPPFPTQQPPQQQQFIHEQQQYQQHPSPMVNNCLPPSNNNNNNNSNNNNPHPHHHNHHHHHLHQHQYQQPPPVYVPNNPNNTTQSPPPPPPPAVITDHSINVNNSNDVNSTLNNVNNTLSQSPMGVNVSGTGRDLSSC